MSIGEYITVFAAIVVGLAVVELIVSFHRLLRQGRDIKWDWMTPLFAALVFAFILNLWWALFRWYGAIDELAFWRFLPDITVLVTLSLLASSVLPDTRLPAGSSLREFYMTTRRQSWWLLAFYCLLAAGRAAIDRSAAGVAFIDWFAAISANLVIAAIAVYLGFTSRVWAHGAALILLALFVAQDWLGDTIR